MNHVDQNQELSHFLGKQPPQTHQSPLVGWSKYILSHFHFSLGGVQSSSSHRGGKNSPRSRISLFILTSLLLNLDAHKLGDFPISALQGTFSSQKLVIIGSSTQKRDERCQIGWRSHQHVASKVVRMMPRLKNRKNLTNTMEPKPTSWKGDDRMDRRRQPTSGVENPRIVQSIVLPKISRKPSLSRETRESDTVH